MGIIASLLVKIPNPLMSALASSCSDEGEEQDPGPKSASLSQAEGTGPWPTREAEQLASATQLEAERGLRSQRARPLHRFFQFHYVFGIFVPYYLLF